MGETLAFFQSCSNTPDSRDLFMTRANDSEMYGADSFSNTTSIPRISLFDFFRWEMRYFSISVLDNLVKQKVWILFEPFQNKSSGWFRNLELVCYRYWQMLIKIISRNVTSNAKMFIFIMYKSFYLWPHSLRIISAKDDHITKIGFLSYLDDTLLYFSVPCIAAITRGHFSVSHWHVHYHTCTEV